MAGMTRMGEEVGKGKDAPYFAAKAMRIRMRAALVYLCTQGRPPPLSPSLSPQHWLEEEEAVGPLAPVGDKAGRGTAAPAASPKTLPSTEGADRCVSPSLLCPLGARPAYVHTSHWGIPRAWEQGGPPADCLRTQGEIDGEAEGRVATRASDVGRGG